MIEKCYVAFSGEDIRVKFELENYCGVMPLAKCNKREFIYRKKEFYT